MSMCQLAVKTIDAMNTHTDLSPSCQVKVWENKRLWAGKGHGAGKKAERWKKRAWRWGKGHGAGKKGHGAAPC